jgi:hypothetical protein
MLALIQHEAVPMTLSAVIGVATAWWVFRRPAKGGQGKP